MFRVQTNQMPNGSPKLLHVLHAVVQRDTIANTTSQKEAVNSHHEGERIQASQPVTREPGCSTMPVAGRTPRPKPGLA